MGRPREKPCSLAFQSLSTMPAISTATQNVPAWGKHFDISTFCSSYIFHLRSVNECFEKENNPFSFHRLSCIPTSSRPLAFTTPTFCPVTRKTYTSTEPTSSSRVSKLLFSCTLTTAILTYPSSPIVALTSSQSVSIVFLIQDGTVGPSCSAHCTLTATV